MNAMTKSWLYWCNLDEIFESLRYGSNIGIGLPTLHLSLVLLSVICPGLLEAVQYFSRCWSSA